MEISPMNVFPFNNDHGEKCPICGKDNKEDALLIPIAGTEEGKNAMAIQVHVSCLVNNLWYYEGKFIVAKSEHPFKK